MHSFRKLIMLWTLPLPLLLLPATLQAAGFQPWSEKVFQEIEKEYGRGGADRMRKLHDIVRDNYDKPETVKLKVTNDTLNHLPWIADRDKYSKDDYWATPLETIATFGGDCEDIAIAKFMMLRIMGVPAKKLRLTYVKIKKTGENHMVLVYFPEPDNPNSGKPALVLDNYVDEIKTGKQRTDLLAIYLVSADNKLTLLNDDGNNRSVKMEKDNAKLAKLDTIKQKIAANMEKFKELNDGRPLF